MEKSKYPPRVKEALRISRLLSRQGKRRMERKKERERLAAEPKKNNVRYLGPA